ncbi:MULTISPECIES: hypothetical protein [unclassified Nostoc]|nr:hypothetical protein [Nostoc sp. NMS8]
MHWTAAVFAPKGQLAVAVLEEPAETDAHTIFSASVSGLKTSTT